MVAEEYHFQYCPKLVVFSQDGEQVLLAKRYGEADYDGTFAFIGGKLETTDESIDDGLRREKTQEVGTDCRIRVATQMPYTIRFVKSDGNMLLVPHHYAEFVGGDIRINPDEYSDYAWVKLSELEAFEPKIPNIPQMVQAVLRLKPLLTQSDFITI